MDGSNLSREKRIAFEVIERNARAIALTGDNIFYFGELGNQEYESAALMSGLLEEGGILRSSAACRAFPPRSSPPTARASR